MCASTQFNSIQPGDEVLVLLPILGSSLQVGYSGPYLIQGKVGERDYLTCRHRNRLCHISMLKLYCDREQGQVESSSEAGGGFMSP